MLGFMFGGFLHFEREEGGAWLLQTMITLGSWGCLLPVVLSS